jgi:hypothetical protein
MMVYIDITDWTNLTLGMGFICGYFLAYYLMRLGQDLDEYLEERRKRLKRRSK